MSHQNHPNVRGCGSLATTYGCGMVATSETRSRGARTTARVRLRTDVFDARMAQLGAKTRSQQARLLGMDRTALAHIIAGRKSCSLERALDISTRMDLTVEDLFERAA